MFVKKVDTDIINKISKLPGHNFIEYTIENINNGDENIDYDLVIMEKLNPFGPWFQKDIKSNPVGYDTSGAYAINFKSYVEEFNHYQYQRDILQEYSIIANWYSKYDNKYGTRYVYSASSVKNEPKYNAESVFDITFRDGIVRNKKMCEVSKLIKNKKLTCDNVSFKDVYMKENGNVFTFYGGFVTIDKRQADTIVFLSLTPDTNL